MGTPSLTGRKGRDKKMRKIKKMVRNLYISFTFQKPKVKEDDDYCPKAGNSANPRRFALI